MTNAHRAALLGLVGLVAPACGAGGEAARRPPAEPAARPLRGDDAGAVYVPPASDEDAARGWAREGERIEEERQRALEVQRRAVEEPLEETDVIQRLDREHEATQRWIWRGGYY